LLPLVQDVFFGAMAVTIVVGLLFASVLTLFVIPVLYAAFFRLRPP
jgi:multidrug efflux pump subunit AcrB